MSREDMQQPDAGVRAAVPDDACRLAGAGAERPNTMMANPVTSGRTPRDQSTSVCLARKQQTAQEYADGRPLRGAWGQMQADRLDPTSDGSSLRTAPYKTEPTSDELRPSLNGSKPAPAREGKAAAPASTGAPRAGAAARRQRRTWRRAFLLHGVLPAIKLGQDRVGERLGGRTGEALCDRPAGQIQAVAVLVEHPVGTQLGRIQTKKHRSVLKASDLQHAGIGDNPLTPRGRHTGQANQRASLPRRQRHHLGAPRDI